MSDESPSPTYVRLNDGAGLTFGFRLHLHRPQSPTLILLHGRTWCGETNYHLRTADENLSLADALCERGLNSAVVDLAGYNRPRGSGAGRPVLTGQGAVAQVRRVCSYLKREARLGGAFYLFGYSLGAAIAHLYVQSYPADYSGVIFFGYAVQNTASYPRLIPGVPTTRAMALEDFLAPDGISAEAKEAFVRTALRNDPVRQTWDLSDFSRLDPTLIHVPALFVVAQHDPCVSCEQARAFMQKLSTPVRRFAFIPGADHAALLGTSRALFYTHIAAFIAAMERRGEVPYRRP